MISDNIPNTELLEHTELDGTQDIPALALTEPKPWSFWPTIGFSAIIAVAYIAVSVVVVIVALIAHKVASPQADIGKLAETVGNSGLVISIAGILTLPVVVGLCVLFSHLRKGITLRQYLGLFPITLRQAGGWLAALVVFSVVEDIFYTLVGAPNRSRVYDPDV